MYVARTTYCCRAYMINTTSPSPTTTAPQAVRTPNHEGIDWQKASLRTGESLDNLRRLLKNARSKVCGGSCFLFCVSLRAGIHAAVMSPASACSPALLSSRFCFRGAPSVRHPLPQMFQMSSRGWLLAPCFVCPPCTPRRRCCCIKTLRTDFHWACLCAWFRYLCVSLHMYTCRPPNLHAAPPVSP